MTYIHAHNFIEYCLFFYKYTFSYIPTIQNKRTTIVCVKDHTLLLYAIMYIQLLS